MHLQLEEVQFYNQNKEVTLRHNLVSIHGAILKNNKTLFNTRWGG